MPPRTKTIAELESQLRAQQQAAGKLQIERDKLVRELEKIDRQIALITGQGQTRKAWPGRKSKKASSSVKKTRKTSRKTGSRGGNSLVEKVAAVLTEADGPMRVKDLVSAVKKAGYKTKSKDFYGIVAATVRNADRFKKVSRGVYTVA